MKDIYGCGKSVLGDLTADLLKVVSLLRGVLAQTSHHHRAIPVEHSITCGTIADTPAQIVLLAGILGLANHTRGQNQRGSLIHVTAHGERITVPGHQGDHPALHKFHAHALCMAVELIHHFRPGHAGDGLPNRC